MSDNGKAYSKIILGQQFMHNIYTILDYDKNEITFSAKKNSIGAETQP